MSRSEEVENENEERNQITTSIMKTEYEIKASDLRDSGIKTNSHTPIDDDESFNEKSSTCLNFFYHLQPGRLDFIFNIHRSNSSKEIENCQFFMLEG